MDGSTDSDQTPLRYSNEKARTVFRKAAREGAIVLTKHARKRMREYGVDNNDILSLARTGVILIALELDIKTNEWTYRIESDGLQLKAVFTILDPSRVRLLTVMTD